MKFKPRLTDRARRGFTLAEVLAALVFMAIVIPVAIEGLRVASRAGVMAQRKMIAARVADRVLHESLLGGQFQTARNGVALEGVEQYRWSIRTEPWREDAMRLITVEVVFPVQGQDFDVHLSTLVSNAQ